MRKYKGKSLSGELASQLLFSDLNQTTSDVATDCTSVTSCHEAIVTVLRNLDTQFLCHFVLQLIQSGIRLRNN